MKWCDHKRLILVQLTGNARWQLQYYTKVEKKQCHYLRKQSALGTIAVKVCLLHIPSRSLLWKLLHIPTHNESRLLLRLITRRKSVCVHYSRETVRRKCLLLFIIIKIYTKWLIQQQCKTLATRRPAQHTFRAQSSLLPCGLYKYIKIHSSQPDTGTLYSVRANKSAGFFECVRLQRGASTRRQMFSCASFCSAKTPQRTCALVFGATNISIRTSCCSPARM